MLITLARKPLMGSVVQNVLTHGCGTLNIDGTRIGTEGGTRRDGRATMPNDVGWQNMRGHGIATLNAGRWPANVLHDGSEAVLAGFPQTQSGSLSAQQYLSANRNNGSMFAGAGVFSHKGYAPDSGSAARFFKQIKGNDTP